MFATNFAKTKTFVKVCEFSLLLAFHENEKRGFSFNPSTNGKAEFDIVNKKLKTIFAEQIFVFFSFFS
jgi:hypothetical protein